MSDREVWFEHYRVGQRIKAIPVHWKGWVILLALCLAPGGGVVALMLWRPAVPTGWILAYMLASMVLVFTTAIVLVRKRGRRRR